MVPLRQRGDDIALLARYFLDLAAAKYGRNMSSISPQAMKLLETYDWPGNVRQLEHLIDQIVITNNEPQLTGQMLPDEITKAAPRSEYIDTKTHQKPVKAAPSIQEMQRHLILQALESSGGSVSTAARQLGLSEATVYRKIKKFGIRRTFVKQR
jgi:two-component system response regulator HydG